MKLPWGRDAGSHPPDYWHWLEHRRPDPFECPDGAPVHGPPSQGPALSVIIPVFRPPISLLLECMHSVIHQSYRTWEMRLHDDGSVNSELSNAIIGLASSDPRIHVSASHQHRGAAYARNRALAQATGDFVVLVDHDAVLDIDGLAEIASVAIERPDVDVIYSDEDVLDASDRPFRPSFKPDWDPFLLLTHPYLGHVLALRAGLLRSIGGFRTELEGSHEYDVMLRSTERARRVEHIPKVLYHGREATTSASEEGGEPPDGQAAGHRVLEDAMARRGIEGVVAPGPFRGSYQLRRQVHGSPSVSVIIPFRDQARLTMACLDSLERDPGYDIGEVVLVDNGSREPETRAMRQLLGQRSNIRIIDHPGTFNWASINNAAVATCSSEMLLFLNNDIEAISPGWLHALVELGQQEEVGAVGARLIHPDGTLQHAGVVLGLGGIAGHLFFGKPRDASGYGAWDRMVRGYSAVSAACMLVRRATFEAIGGFDELFAVSFNDIDFCIRLRRAGYQILYTPHAELMHYESASRGLSGYYHDYQRFLSRWMELLRQGDPCYNRNLGRLQPWCPLRPPQEDEEWFALVSSLVQPRPGPGEEASDGHEEGIGAMLDLTH